MIIILAVFILKDVLSIWTDLEKLFLVRLVIHL